MDLREYIGYINNTVYSDNNKKQYSNSVNLNVMKVTVSNIHLFTKAFLNWVVLM